MFIGRKEELKKLNEMYQSDQFEFAVIYGRRRVGKSTLIKEFCKDKRFIYYMGVEANHIDNIQGLSQAIFDEIMPGLKIPYFSSYEELLNFIDTISTEKIIIAIDEYPYMAESYRSLSSLIQKHIDLKWKSGKLKLILCGSSMSLIMRSNGEYVYKNFVENEISKYMGKVFEDICLTYMQNKKILPTVPFPFQEIGRWWGGNPIKKQKEEIDICAMTKDHVLLRECKWTNKLI